MNLIPRRTWNRIAKFVAIAVVGILAILTIAYSAASAAPVNQLPTRVLVDAGGGVNGTWTADTSSTPSAYLSGGQTTYVASTTHAIDMSDPSIRPGTPAAIFQTERWSPGSSLNYAVPFAPGSSTVRLYFAEIYPGAQAAGARVMNVVIDGATVERNLDVYKLVGGYKALLRTYTVESTGPVSISITNPTNTNSPHLMGLSIVAGSSGPPPVTTTTQPVTTTTQPVTATTQPVTTTTQPVTTTTPTTTPSTSSSAGLGTPLACPSGSVAVSPGNVPNLNANTNYCFARGTYRNFSATLPSGDGWYGQGSAILDGGGSQLYSIVSNGTTSNVVIDGFTIRNYHYGCNGSECVSPAAIELHSGTNVTISDNTIGPSQTGAIDWGAGLNPGQYSSGAYSAGIDNSTITHNLITTVGYTGTKVVGGSNDTVSYNEVTRTDQFNVDTEADVAAIGKFAVDANTTVVGNYVHDNQDTAIWFDVYNTNTTIKDNTITNDRVGIFYELSCNAVIDNNKISNVGYADAESSAYGAAIRISASGSSLAAPCNSYGGSALPGPKSITVTGNTMTNDHEGITEIDGHGSNIPVNNIAVSGNTTTGDTTSTGGTGDAWLVHTDNPNGQNNTFANDIYLANPSNTIFSPGQSVPWSAWTSRGFDTGGRCSRIGGGSC